MSLHPFPFRSHAAEHQKAAGLLEQLERELEGEEEKKEAEGSHGTTGEGEEGEEACLSEQEEEEEEELDKTTEAVLLREQDSPLQQVRRSRWSLAVCVRPGRPSLRMRFSGPSDGELHLPV